ncbi:ComEA family DNA-binding protein [Arthrobacter antibioticus]|uniref:ComEA family DNA-binding protein n=1 Tax=Arthrobacter sp. H35-MC1 TaxID=3046203 RepID=UPI0024BAC03E|nr:ComEA family DNA-binding protein [Arthrobacter sp. H35-MC1]MDJ0315891.1 ComEA family DNA-binding protein [Arthrobacter sp. H35-MC1]
MGSSNDDFNTRSTGAENTGRGESNSPGPLPRNTAHVVGARLPLRGPRWVISLRAIVVVLAMMAATLGILWIESAGVQVASAELSTEHGGKVAVPAMDGPSPVSSEESLNAAKASAGASASIPATGAGADAAATPGAPLGLNVQQTQNSLVVHVVGAVKNPGVFVLEQGKRIFQALGAAGGALPTAELSALNLAAPLTDGMQILVLTQEQAASMPAQPGVAELPETAHVPGAVGQPLGNPGVGSAPLLNLNTATAAEFDALPGIGPVLADRIVAWRTDHGRYSSVDALDAVSGIGAKLLAGLRDLVTVS